MKGNVTMFASQACRLVAKRTGYNNATYVCHSCLHPFKNQQAHDNHLSQCLRYLAQMTIYPDPQKQKDCSIEFRAHRKQFRLPFYLVADFESFLIPSDETEFGRATRVINEHDISGFACHRVTDIDKYKTPPVVYSGPNPMSAFYEHIMKESREISNILGVEIPMLPLTQE